MAVHHLNDITPYGSADKIADWFITFTAWLTGTVGWTLEAAPGPTERVFSSIGEAGGFTMLFFRIWQQAGTNRIRGEVSDDAIPTHETDEAGYLDTDIGDRFRYYITADLDAVLMAVPYRDDTHFLYLGCLIPVAITPVDETYYMIASEETLTNCSILRNSAGVWDFDETIHPDTPGYSVCSVAGSEIRPVGAYYCEDHNDIAGQLKFLGYGNTGTLSGSGDRLTSTISDAVWQIMGGLGTTPSMLIEGTQPATDQPDGVGFNSVAGVAGNAAAFLNALDACLTAAGWTVTDELGPHSLNKLCYSPGSDGLRNIWALYCYQNFAPWNFLAYVQRDAIGTDRTGVVRRQWQPAWFPCNYWISADRDCFITVLQDGAGWYAGHWMGMPRALDLSLDDALSICIYGVWDQFIYMVQQRPAGGALRRRDRAACYSLSNANAYDPNTYCVWPYTFTQQYAESGGQDDVIGDMGLYFYTDGGGIAVLDTITVGAKVYTVFDRTGAGQFYAIRTT